MVATLLREFDRSNDRFNEVAVETVGVVSGVFGNDKGVFEDTSTDDNELVENGLLVKEDFFFNDPNKRNKLLGRF